MGKFPTYKGQTKTTCNQNISSRQELLQGLLAEVFTLLADDEDRPQHLQVVCVAGIPPGCDTIMPVRPCHCNFSIFCMEPGGKRVTIQKFLAFTTKSFTVFSFRQVDLASVGLQVLEPFLQAEDWLLGPVCFEVLIKKTSPKKVSMKVLVLYFIFVPHPP